MAFTGWTVETTNQDAVIHEFFGVRRLGPHNGVERDLPNLDAPLGGTGTLQMQFLDAALKGHIYRTPANRRGFTSGSVRCWWHAQIETGAGAYAFGCYCMASQVGLVGGTGSLYLLACNVLSEERRVRLLKSTTGLDATATMLAQTPVDQWPLQETFTLELRWLATAGLLRLEAWQGSAAHFGDQALVLSYEDSSPLTTTVAEGLWADSRTTSVLNVFADQTRTKGALAV